MSLNVAVCSGRFVKDPTLSTTNNGKNLVNFTLAVDKDGGKDSGTDFIDCTAWNGTAEHICKYFHKGDSATVSGRITVRDWTDKNDNKRRAVEITVNTIYFGIKKRTVTQDDWAEATEQTEIDEFVDDESDGELPF